VSRSIAGPLGANGFVGLQKEPGNRLFKDGIAAAQGIYCDQIKALQKLAKAFVFDE
jgi:hypothetical protein